MLRAKLIEYVCVAKDHQPTDGRLDKLTVNDGAWAFCPFDTKADGHVWERVDAADVEHVVRRFGLSALSQLGTERSGAPSER